MRASRYFRLQGLLVAGLGLAAGCGGGAEAEIVAAQESPSPIGLVCPTDLCGSTKLLYTDGTLNHTGASLQGIFGRHGALTAMVTGDELGGFDGHGTSYNDFALLGDSLRVNAPLGTFDIELHAVASPPSWVGDGSPPARAYLLQYRPTGEPDAKPRPFCGWPNRSKRWENAAGLAFLFRGDVFDDVHKTVTASEDDTGFNLVCAGDPIAGTYLAGHSDASDAMHVTSEADRQAMYKMLAGDYCGQGRSFAFDTPPAQFVDASGRLPPLPKPPTAQTLEAVWTAQGALCLQNPRFAQMAGKIAGACSLPRCDQLVPDGIAGLLEQWPQLGHVLSANDP